MSIGCIITILYFAIGTSLAFMWWNDEYKVKYEYDSSSNKNLFSDMMGELKPYLKKVRFF